MEIATHRYSNDEIHYMLDKYAGTLGKKEDFKSLEELTTLMFTGWGARRHNRELIAEPENRKHYLLALEGYKERVESGMPFNILKAITYDSNVEKKYFRSDDIIVHMLEAPFEEMPLYINSKEGYAAFFSKWRMEIGK